MKKSRITMKYSRWMLISAFILSVVSANAATQALSEDDFNQQIQQYIDIVNQTKTILDDPDTLASIEAQQQALCQRIHAYQDIVKLSNEYPKFENAMLMKWVAQHYLERQKVSLQSSGLNEGAICSAVHSL